LNISFSWFQEGNWWINNIGEVLDEGTSFHRGGCIAYLLIAAWWIDNVGCMN
jgi:hypothetical protein